GVVERIALALLAGDHIDQPRQFGERVLGRTRRRAPGAQAPFEFVEIDFRNDLGTRAAHDEPRWRSPRRRPRSPGGSLERLPSPRLGAAVCSTAPASASPP